MNNRRYIIYENDKKWFVIDTHNNDRIVYKGGYADVGRACEQMNLDHINKEKNK
jgi:hypothetical protein